MGGIMSEAIKKEPTPFDRLRGKYFEANTAARNEKFGPRVTTTSEELKSDVDKFLANKDNKIITKRPPTS